MGGVTGSWEDYLKEISWNLSREMQVATSTGMQHYIKMHCYGFDCLLHITAESL